MFIFGSEAFRTRGERFWVSVHLSLCDKSTSQIEILHKRPTPLWATERQEHLLSMLAFTLSIFRANGPSQSWSLTCNSPIDVGYQSALCEYIQLTQWLHINSFILPQAKGAGGPTEIRLTNGAPHPPTHQPF